MPFRQQLLSLSEYAPDYPTLKTIPKETMMASSQNQTISIEIIGYISSCFKEKFATPRQPGLAPSATARLILVEPFNRREMVRGLETFSHIWVQFLFHQVVGDGWKTTVRPPRLGGSERKGVWATRSPHRPNHIGLSAVTLEGIDVRNGVELVLSGVDLLDRTPVIDIKPYLPVSDRPEGVTDGWSERLFAPLDVCFTPAARDFCSAYRRRTGDDLATLITEVLHADPRPASQRATRKEFGMLLWDVNVRWSVDGVRCVVTGCEQV